MKPLQPFYSKTTMALPGDETMNEVRYNNIIYNNLGSDTVSNNILQKGLKRKTFGKIRAEDMCIQNAVEPV